MRNTVTGLLALPAVLSAIVFATPSYSQDWPYNLPLDAKYYPEHEHIIKRDLEIQQKLDMAAPSGVRKMSDHEGEKFFLDYWHFDEQTFNSTALQHCCRISQTLKNYSHHCSCMQNLNSLFPDSLVVAYPNGHINAPLGPTAAHRLDTQTAVVLLAKLACPSQRTMEQR
jgi:hypothetical protein